jgi:hypothetical protein
LEAREKETETRNRDDMRAVEKIRRREKREEKIK